jgi:alkylation response protein AidB-like acyl-CoA dehydrogenase
MDDESTVLELCDRLLAEHPPAATEPAAFLGAQFDLGLAWVHFPEGHGGRDLAPGLQRTVNERLFEAGAPNPYWHNPIGHGMGAPTVVTHGSDDQKDRYLRPLFTGEEMWCQMFSEPGAGSDVAGLAMSAVRDGDEWVVNGQKVWTTLAHLARYGMLLARTDPDVPKHRGLTYFVVDMQAEGVDVRPLRQMTGDAEFNEVFFADVRVPDDGRLGAVGDGWRVSTTTLMNERVAIGGTVSPRGSGPIAEAVRLWAEAGRTDPVARARLADLWVRAEVARLTNIRAQQLRSVGNPGPEGSVGKLVSAELNKDIGEFCVDLLGAPGQLYGNYAMRTGAPDGSPQRSFLRTRANSIEGGTSEVMRNILGERVLGLPGEPRADKDVPWVDVPRN